MVRLVSFHPVRWLLIALLGLMLWGCGLTNPKPPLAVVESAIAQRLAQTQVVFAGQPSPASAAPVSAQVGGVQVDHHSRVNVGGQWALEVTGTYRLRASDLSHAQRRQTRPFEIYLQRDLQDQWFLLTPEIEEASTSAQWRAIPLMPGA